MKHRIAQTLSNFLKNSSSPNYKLLDRIIEWLFVMYSIWGLRPFFTWETYHNGMFKSIGSILYTGIFFLCAFILLVCKFSVEKIHISKGEGKLAVLVLFSSILLLGVSGGEIQRLFSGSVIPYLMLFLYMLLPRKMKANIYKYYFAVFAVTLILPMIYYLLSVIGINVPHEFVDSYESIKSSDGINYIHYPFAVQINSAWNPLTKLRFSGIYDEAGRLGTLAALFLASEKFNFKGKTFNIIVLISGIITFSVSFYIIVIVYFVLKNLIEHKFKNVAGLMLIILAYIIVLNVSFDSDSILSKLQSRIVITNEGISGDNRTNIAYDALFQKFQSSDLITLMFGYGENGIGRIQELDGIDGSSYKSLIFNYGYVGFGISILWIVLFAYYSIKKNWKYKDEIIILTILYLVNIYQRPSAFFLPYMLIYLSGVYNVVSLGEYRNCKK